MRRGLVSLWLLVVCSCTQSPAPAAPGMQDATGAAHSAGAVLMPDDPPSCAPAGCERACTDHDDGTACARAAERYGDGKPGHVFDPARSFGLAKRGCNAGDGLACALLGQHYGNGIATDWAPQLAVAVYDKACTAGVGLGCFNLGIMYERGHGVDPDPAKARTYYKLARAHWLAACQGDEPRWCLSAARLTAYDDAPNQSPSLAALVQRACSHGFKAGCASLLRARLTASAAKPGPLYDVVTRALDKLCRDGEPTACEHLAQALSGDDVPQQRRDPTRVAELSARACELGDPQSCVAAGIHRELGKGVPVDKQASRRYFALACDRGDRDGCLVLAKQAVKDHRSPDIARFAQRACQMGSSRACEVMARVMILQRDQAASVRWSVEGCRLGSSPSCYRLIELGIEIPAIAGDDRRALYQSGCDIQIESACAQLAKIDLANQAVLRALIDAVAAQDAAAFARLVPDDIHILNLWFADPGCQAQFSGEFVLNAANQPAFLRCLATLDVYIQSPTYRHQQAGLVYDPGIGVSVGVWDGAIHRIAGTLSPSRDPAVAPVSSDTLASHRIAGTHVVTPEQAVHDSLARSKKEVAFARLYVCVDQTGKPIEITVADRSTGYDSYVHAVEAVAAQWRFRPFLAHGKPISVCAFDLFAYPPDREFQIAPKPAQPPSTGGAARETTTSGAPPNVAPTAVEARRIAGIRNILPDDRTKTEISRSGRSKLVGSFKVCLQETGDVANVTLLKSTGFVEYDRTIVRTIYDWLYTPFLIDGVPARVCTAVTFIYSQS
jgi:TPR repeat protein